MINETKTKQKNDNLEMTKGEEGKAGLYIAIFTILGILGMIFVIFSGSANSAGVLVISNVLYEYIGVGLLLADIVFMILGIFMIPRHSNPEAA